MPETELSGTKRPTPKPRWLPTTRPNNALPAPMTLRKSLAQVPALLVCCVELWTLAVTDKDLDRQSIVGGGSLYTFVQNVLLGCRNEGLGSALTTLLAAEEAAVADMLGLPDEVAVGALVAVGWPVPEKQYTKLSRKPVEEVVFRNRYGSAFEISDQTAG